MHYFKVYLLTFKCGKDTSCKLVFIIIVFFHLLMHFSHQRWSCLLTDIHGLGGAESPVKENVVGFVVPDEEEKRVVCIKFKGGESSSKAHLTPSTSCSLCTLFIYFYKRLVENIGQK